MPYHLCYTPLPFNCGKQIIAFHIFTSKSLNHVSTQALDLYNLSCWRVTQKSGVSERVVSFIGLCLKSLQLFTLPVELCTVFNSLLLFLLLQYKIGIPVEYEIQQWGLIDFNHYHPEKGIKGFFLQELVEAGFHETVLENLAKKHPRYEYIIKDDMIGE